MKILSLWQPHASAIALGLKTIETRSWGTAYRGPIAIHAAKKWDAEIRGIIADLSPVTLTALGSTNLWSFGRGWDFPFGKIVATAWLLDCCPTTDGQVFAKYPERNSAMEWSLGNYEPHRYGWVLSKIRSLPEPLPFKGGQGLRDLPPEIEQQLTR